MTEFAALRRTDIVNSNINHLLDQAEYPVKMIRFTQMEKRVDNLKYQDIKEINMPHSETEIIVRPVNDNATQGILKMGNKSFPCALGKGGITRTKTEGDMKTPVGKFPLRSVFYRYDKLSEPIYSRIPMRALLREDGWCDDPEERAYNQLVMLPYHASAESLWRDDDVYDLIVVLGHNDSPVEKDKGSAIFLHVARDLGDDRNLEGTEGCIALKKQDLLEILPKLLPETTLKVVSH